MEVTEPVAARRRINVEVRCPEQRGGQQLARFLKKSPYVIAAVVIPGNH